MQAAPGQIPAWDLQQKLWLHRDMLPEEDKLYSRIISKHDILLAYLWWINFSSTAVLARYFPVDKPMEGQGEMLGDWAEGWDV